VRDHNPVNPDHKAGPLRDLVGNGAAKEATILSTCNRTEVYCSTNAPAQAVGWLADYHKLGVGEIEPYIYRLPQEQAVKHAFRVASGLDSMVLGEPQILGQMKQAVRQAEQASTLGFLLHKLFQRTFSVAKDVRTQTEIGANLVSMAAAAVKLAERIYPSISEQNVLFIGAGEMIELNAVHFAARKPKTITVANRTLERAQTVARRVEGHAVTLNELPEQLARHDIIVTCTASQLPFLAMGLIVRALKARRDQLDAGLDALTYVQANVDALGWEEAPRRLADSQALVPGLEAQLLRPDHVTLQQHEGPLREVVQLAHDEVVLHQAVSELADDDVRAVLLVRPLQPGAEVHVVAHEGVVHPPGRAHVAHRHDAGIEADSDVDPFGLRPAFVQLPKLLHLP
jgi:hypothetical protein